MHTFLNTALLIMTDIIMDILAKSRTVGGLKSQFTTVNRDIEWRLALQIPGCSRDLHSTIYHLSDSDFVIAIASQCSTIVLLFSLSPAVLFLTGTHLGG